jgi:protoporphyrinogen oxidase
MQRGYTGSRQNVAVIGGGISGLVSAYRLLQQGYGVTVFEADAELGGLGGTFEHVMLPSDGDLLGLLEELGMSRQVIWRETSMGFLHQKQVYPFNTALDLLRYGGLSVPARLRTALGAAYASKVVRDPAGLDEISVAEWLERIFGTEAFLQLWRPLLRAKFGDCYDTVPALWFWSRLHREKAAGPERKGYPAGGYRGIAARLQREIERLGGKIRLRMPVYALKDLPDGMEVVAEGKVEQFDSAISTMPLPQLFKISRGPLTRLIPQTDLAYMGVVNVVVILRQQLQKHYWNAIVNRGYPFQGMVETTNAVPLGHTGGRHLVYFLNYAAQNSETYNLTDAALKWQALKSVRDFNPALGENAIEDMKVFRAPYVEPVWKMGYQSEVPSMRVGASHLYLATTAQAYPKVNSWNTMTGLANEVAARVAFDLSNRRPARTPEVVANAGLVAVA